MVLAGALTDLIPGNLNFSGGVGLAGFLAVLFPLIERILVGLFNFDVAEYFGRFFNQDSFFGKSFGIVGIGAAIAGLQQLWERSWKVYYDYFSISIEISAVDNSYKDVLKWVKERQWKDWQHMNMKTKSTLLTSGKWESSPELHPTNPINHFYYEGKKIFTEVFEKEKPDEDGNSLYLRLSSTGINTLVFQKMTEEFKKFQMVKQEEETSIYFGHQGYWNCNASRRKRPLDSVILEKGVAESVIEDIKEFMESAQWYCEFGVPYRRGYLLYGPPGTGKTSFVTAVAGFFDLDVCILNLSEKSLDDEKLVQLLSQVPARSIVLLEDIDAAFVSREESKHNEDLAVSSEAANRLTFSGLLNALDGVASAEGRLLFMTTNHITKLDPALIRPGRVDIRQCIGYASENQINRMYQRFHPKASVEEASEFTAAVMRVLGDKQELSLARPQGLFLRYKKRPQEIVNGIMHLVEDEHVL